MVILIKVVQFLLSLLILIVLHELGHFSMAKLFGVRVDKFYVFFNPGFSLWKKKIGKTVYGLGWLPLGGYVKIGGMVDESMDHEQLKRPAAPDDFRVKPAWQRLLIMSGGVLVNLLLAWVIYSALLFTHGMKYIATDDITYGIAADSLGTEIGFRSGDRVLYVNGRSYADYNEMLSEMLLEPDAVVTVSRQDSLVNVPIQREYLETLLSGVPPFTVRMPMVVAGVVPGSAAEVAGFQVGDSLVALGGKRAMFFDEFRDFVRSRVGDTVSVVVARAGSFDTLRVGVPESGTVGVQADADFSRFFSVRTRTFGLLQSIGMGASMGFERVVGYCKSLKMLFIPEAKAHKSLGGFISIAKMFPGEWDWAFFWNFTAFLSIILAVMNFLPIPGLDGGHVMFLLYEVVTGRKPSERFLTVAIMFGMALLLILVLYANLNDVFKLFH